MSVITALTGPVDRAARYGMLLFRADTNHTEPDPVHRVGKLTQNTRAETVRNITERPGDEMRGPGFV